MKRCIKQDEKVMGQSPIELGLIDTHSLNVQWSLALVHFDVPEEQI